MKASSVEKLRTAGAALFGDQTVASEEFVSSLSKNVGHVFNVPEFSEK